MRRDKMMHPVNELCFDTCYIGCELWNVDAAGLDQDKCIPRVHHVVQAGDSGPPCFQTQEVEIFHSGRGTTT